jgi:transposase-like protein
MNKPESLRKSRKATPWDYDTNLTTPTQAFLKQHYENHYADHHRKIIDSDEANMINSYIPVKCPFCGSVQFKKCGYTNNRIQRYRCICDKTFLPTTGTIFDEHKISISEWMEYCLNLFRHVSITADSWNNKNAFRTSRYWLQKLFLTLDGVQNDIVLSGNIWLDETFYSVISEDIVRNGNGGKLRGLSNNQICIGVATDKLHTVLLVEGTGKPSQKKTLETFRSHIEEGSTLIHDKESAHKSLIKELFLSSEAYASKDLKGLPDKDNPMNPVNQVHVILKKFLNSHSGFNREDIQGYLNLFAFVTNSPIDRLEKVELVLKMAFQNPKSLRFRDFYSANARFYR